MVQYPTASTEDANGLTLADYETKNQVIHRALAAAARTYEACYGHPVTYVAAFNLPSGAWAPFISQNAPPSLITAVQQTLSVSSGKQKVTDDEDEPVQKSPTQTPQTFEFQPSETVAPRPTRAVPRSLSNTVHFQIKENVQNFLRALLRNLQQLAVKAVLKAWIKVVEPRKQSSYPYIGGARPPWWPTSIKFREPDHLKIDHRIELALVVIQVYRSKNLVSALHKTPQKHARQGAPNGWINMLRGSTKDMTLSFESENKRKEKQVYREQVLRTIYDAAEICEEIHHGNRDISYSKTYGVELLKKDPKMNARRPPGSQLKLRRKKEDQVLPQLLPLPIANTMDVEEVGYDEPQMTSEEDDMISPDTTEASYDMPEATEASYDMPEATEASYDMPETTEATYGVPDMTEAAYGVPNTTEGIYDVPETVATAPQQSMNDNFTNMASYGYPNYFDETYQTQEAWAASMAQFNVGTLGQVNNGENIAADQLGNFSMPMGNYSQSAFPFNVDNAGYSPELQYDMSQYGAMNTNAFMPQEFNPYAQNTNQF